jgi:succinylglutamic semialdehyde dehydrogenase
MYQCLKRKIEVAVNISEKLYIDGSWCIGAGAALSSTNPSTGETLYQGKGADDSQVDSAVRAARASLPSWASMNYMERCSFLEKYTASLESKKDDLSSLIAKENGKPLWEAKTEVAAMLGKFKLALMAFEERCSDKYKELPQETNLYTRHKPHGVLAVYGPFNFPAHLPHGHIIPALLAGNAIIFKPSEMTPAVGEFISSIWDEVGLPKGVFNLLQGHKEVGIAINEHPLIDGILFTGSSNVGLEMQGSLLKYPHRLIALEMGGNNPLVFLDSNDLRASALCSVQSAFITSGQRCTCARRLIVVESEQSNEFLDNLIDISSKIIVDDAFASPEPYMGPLISMSSAEKTISHYQDLVEQGAESLLPAKRLSNDKPFISPSIVDTTSISNLDDVEVFGPLLKVIRVKSLDAAISAANNTRYGLSSGIITEDANSHKKFYTSARAGIINWNKPLTGASGMAPFGGVGVSGNHRPSGYNSADYCSYPVASMEKDKLVPVNDLGTGFLS